MCIEEKKKINPNIFFAIAIVLGVGAGCLQQPFIFSIADALSQIFINLLKLVSLPIIFLSIVSTAAGMESLQQIRQLGQRVLKYTLLTTVIAALVALTLYVVIDPVRGHVETAAAASVPTEHSKTYLSFFLGIVPANIIQPFAENNVMGVLFLAMIFSFAILTLPSQHRGVIHSFFSSLYAAVISITRWIVMLMPIAIWAFVTLFMRDLAQGLEVKSLALYLTCVMAANCIQAFFVLPIFLKSKGVSPWALAKAMHPALSAAFFTKSSAAALPLAMQCAETRAGITPRVASFTLPLCTTINMNACAAFILITVLFVSMSQGVVYTLPEMGVWVILATIAAIGNAGVPMGCFFLASAFLAAMNIPLNILGVILPFYSLIDMFESSINVWSDSCVAAVVNKELEGMADAGVIVDAECQASHSS